MLRFVFANAGGLHLQKNILDYELCNSRSPEDRVSRGDI